MELLKEAWPWYVAGPLIGLMVPFLLWVGNKSFGISSSLRHMCAIVLPLKISFLQYDWRKEKWNLIFVVGLMVGGFLAHQFLHTPYAVDVSAGARETFASYGFTEYQEMAPVQFFQNEFIFSLKGLLITLLGGFLVGFGSRFAGGCTSGHAISGLSNLQLPSLVSVVGFFIGGLVMTYFILPNLLKV